MPFQLTKPLDPTFKTLKPVESATELLVGLARWDLNVEVAVSNEAGRRFKIGFIQILYDNEVKFTYATSVTTVTCRSPVLDSPAAGWVPWYWRPKLYSPVVTGTAGTVKATAKMHDSPDHTISWTAPDGSHLESVSYRLKFKTWLVVRDVTSKPYPNNFTATLSQFNTSIDLAFNIDTSKAVGERCEFATVRKSDETTRAELVNPPTPIHSCVWGNLIANATATRTTTPRTVVVSSVGPVGPVQTGVNVRSLASKAPAVIMTVGARPSSPPPPPPPPPPPSAPKKGGFLRNLFHFGTLPPTTDDE